MSEQQALNREPLNQDWDLVSGLAPVVVDTIYALAAEYNICLRLECPECSSLVLWLSGDRRSFVQGRLSLPEFQDRLGVDRTQKQLSYEFWRTHDVSGCERNSPITDTTPCFDWDQLNCESW